MPGVKDTIDPSDKPNKSADVVDIKKLNPISLKAWPEPDTTQVLRGCEFLKGYIRADEWALDDPNEFKINAFISVTSRLDNGHQLTAKTIRNLYPDWSEWLVTSKIESTKQLSGPRTCENINDLWEGCPRCPHWQSHISSPIQIRSSDFIKTKATGFFNTEPLQNGQVKLLSPNYRDLLAYFQKQFSHRTILESGHIYIYNGEYWEKYPDIRIKQFAEDNFDPICSEHMRKEFLSLVKTKNIVSSNWFTDSTIGFLNCKNGVIDLDKNKLIECDKKYGFTSILPYDFDPDAKCPRFLKFLDEITVGDIPLQYIIVEYLGYCLISRDCKAEKALFLQSDGSSGKSTLVDTFKKVIGQDNVSSSTLSDLNRPTTRALLENKLVNIGEETNANALEESEVFKTAVCGGEIQVKHLYQQEYDIWCKTKFIFLCQRFPKSTDRSHGLYRRLLLVPLRAKFEDGKNKDKDMREKLATELPGILNLIIQYYKEFKARGYIFTESNSVSEKLQEYQVENDNLLYWFLENVHVYNKGELGYSTKFEEKPKLYQHYRGFCLDGGLKPVSTIQFFKRIKDVIPDYNDTRKSINFRRVWVIDHITLKHDDDFD